jgi:hypothetical protein
MNFPSFPHWLSPVWIALYFFVGVAFYLYGNALARRRRERDCREAERIWPEVRGVVFSMAHASSPQQIVVEVPKGPYRGQYRVSVTAQMWRSLSIDQELICRVGRHPGDRVSAPLRCVIERVL